MIELTKKGKEQQLQVIFSSGKEEILSQLSEECCELAQAAQKVRRVLHGTTPANMGESIGSLIEEAGDVLLLLDYVERIGLLDIEMAKESAKKKNERWYGRTVSK